VLVIRIVRLYLGDGSLDEHDYSDAYTTKAQHAGFVLANAAGATQGAAFIMLQICP